MARRRAALVAVAVVFLSSARCGLSMRMDLGSLQEEEAWTCESAAAAVSRLLAVEEKTTTEAALFKSAVAKVQRCNAEREADAARQKQARKEAAAASRKKKADAAARLEKKGTVYDLTQWAIAAAVLVLAAGAHLAYTRSAADAKRKKGRKYVLDTIGKEKKRK